VLAKILLQSAGQFQAMVLFNQPRAAATQALPAQPPEGAAEEVQAGDAAAPSLDPARMAAGNNGDLDSVPVQTEQPAQKPVQKPKPVEKPQPKPQRDTTSEQLAAATETPPAKPAADEKPAPTGKAYVVQLGALKNADKVNEVVAKLRGAGYRVYTSPSTPVQGKITRILVGPDASRDKLKGSLGELNQLSGLSGVVMSYSAN
jgi:DedD protein